MPKKPWAGRFTEETSQLLEDFTSSINFDKELYKYDIKGSIAWAKALNKAKVLSQSEYSKIVSALNKIEKDIEDGKIKLKNEYEDIHMAIEKILTGRIGDIGKKLHTGRSRNDQIATDMRLYLKDEINLIIRIIKDFQKTLVKIAEDNIDLIMPGYTHLQKAQPILFSHHFMAYYQMLARDIERLRNCYARVDVMPLGSGALAGTSYNIDRKALAKDLGFSHISKNSVDAVSDRDFVIEFISDSALIMVHLSRLCEEIIIWSTSEFKFIELSDAFSTGSSIMPQKKNPDIAELTRGKTGRVVGSLMSILTIMKGLPLSYNRDMQEDKEALFDSVHTVKKSLEIMRSLIETMKINNKIISQDTEKDFLVATDLADYLVKKGIPFREAHEIIGKIVRYCIEYGKNFYELSKKDLQGFCAKIDEDIYEYFNLGRSVNAKNVIGGTAKEQVMKAIAEAKIDLKNA